MNFPSHISRVVCGCFVISLVIKNDDDRGLDGRIYLAVTLKGYA